MKLYVFSFLIGIITCPLSGMDSAVKKIVTKYKHETLIKDKKDGWVWDEAQEKHDIAVGNLKKITYITNFPGKFEIICQEDENTLNRIQILITAKRAQGAAFPAIKVAHNTQESVEIINSFDSLNDAYRALDCCLILSSDNFKQSEISADFLMGNYRKQAYAS